MQSTLGLKNCILPTWISCVCEWSFNHEHYFVVLVCKTSTIFEVYINRFLTPVTQANQTVEITNCAPAGNYKMCSKPGNNYVIKPNLYGVKSTSVAVLDRNQIIALPWSKMSKSPGSPSHSAQIWVIYSEHYSTHAEQDLKLWISHCAIWLQTWVLYLELKHLWNKMSRQNLYSQRLI